MAIERALVLSGGSIKGAFQAGAIAHVLTRFEPQAIIGTSVGSLNGGFLAERAGRGAQGGRVDWKKIGDDLEEFWRKRITGFGCIGKKRGNLEVLFSLGKHFNGLYDMEPLRGLIHAELQVQHLRDSPVRFAACAVNIASGEAVYADNGASGILDYIFASTAIPLIMPIVMIGAECFWDGGMREVAPLKKAIDWGASEIVVVAVDTKKIGGMAICAPRAPFLDQAGRLMDIVVNEILNNDIDMCMKINQFIDEIPNPTGKLAEMKKITLTEIRPETTLNIDIEKFTPGDIAELIEAGKKAAEAAMAASP